MFADVCLMCGRPTDGLYCSNECKDLDAPAQPPSSVDMAIDLGFITDSLPQLVSSSRAARRTDQSTASSPTSSILTTPSVAEDLVGSVADMVPRKPHHGKVVGSSSTATLTLANTAQASIHDSHNTLDLYAKAHQQQQHYHSVQPRSPTILPVNHVNLHFIRRPGPTNTRTTQAPPNHRRTASYNATLTPNEPHHRQRHPRPHPTLRLPEASLPHSNGHRAALSGKRTASGKSSAGPSSGVSSPALSATDALSPRNDFSLDAATDSASTSDDTGAVVHSSIDKTRRKRNRASLPAYFSSLLSPSPPSTAISPVNHSDPTDDEDQHPSSISRSHTLSPVKTFTQSHPRGSPSTPRTLKRNNSGGSTVGHRKSNGSSPAVSSFTPVVDATHTPPTPTVPRRTVGHSLLDRSLAMRGTCLLPRRGRPATSATKTHEDGSSALSEQPESEDSPEPPSPTTSTSPPTPAPELPALYKSDSQTRSRSSGRHIRFIQEEETVPVVHKHLKSPSPLRVGDSDHSAPSFSPYAPVQPRGRGSRPGIAAVGRSGSGVMGGHSDQMVSPAEKFRRYSSPQSTLASTRPILITPSMLVSPSEAGGRTRSSTLVEYPGAGMRMRSPHIAFPGAVREDSPAEDEFAPLPRLGGRTTRRDMESGRERDRSRYRAGQETMPEEEMRGRSRSRIRSRSRVRSRSPRSRERERERIRIPGPV